jgi:hypothetical protein
MMLSTRIVVQTRPHLAHTWREGRKGNEEGGEEVRNKTSGSAKFEGKKEHRSKEVTEERKKRRMEERELQKRGRRDKEGRRKEGGGGEELPPGT